VTNFLNYKQIRKLFVTLLIRFNLNKHAKIIKNIMSLSKDEYKKFSIMVFLNSPGDVETVKNLKITSIE
jgi:hypothetical protein